MKNMRTRGGARADNVDGHTTCNRAKQNKMKERRSTTYARKDNKTIKKERYIEMEQERKH